ncbi:MAG: CPCC family cysteine-rich protein [Lacrimispora sphenoides]
MKKVLASRYKCPCCDYYTYPVHAKEAVGFICPVCFWENDVFIFSENEPSDCNHGLTILEGRSNFISNHLLSLQRNRALRPVLYEYLSIIER